MPTALTIEEHYGRPMDIEWGKDGVDGRLYVLQARPETVQSRRTGAVERFRIDPALTKDAEVLVEGRAIGQKIGAGAVRVLTDVEQMHEFVPGEVLVADMTDPDWEPIMKRAGAIVTNRGGRTCHAAIIARELGIPAVVGTGQATRQLSDGQPITVSCAEGDTGYVYAGILDFDIEQSETQEMPPIGVKIMMNVGTPDQAFAFSRLPHSGVGLARLEFIINRQIGIHPRALLDLDELPGAADDGAASDDTLAELQEAFLASEWADRTPLAVEVDLETPVAGLVVRCRVDAVFPATSGLAGAVDVVDWKSGRPPTGERAREAAVQLAVYRLAWARLHRVPLDRVGAAFFYAATGETRRPADLLDEAGLEALVTGLPQAT